MTTLGRTRNAWLTGSPAFGLGAVIVAMSGVYLVLGLGAQAFDGPSGVLVAAWWLTGGPTIAMIDVAFVVPEDLRVGRRLAAATGILLSGVAFVVPLTPLLLAD